MPKPLSKPIVPEKIYFLGQTLTRRPFFKTDPDEELLTDYEWAASNKVKNPRVCVYMYRQSKRKKWNCYVALEWDEAMTEDWVLNPKAARGVTPLEAIAVAMREAHALLKHVSKMLVYKPGTELSPKKAKPKTKKKQKAKSSHFVAVAQPGAMPFLTRSR